VILLWHAPTRQRRGNGETRAILPMASVTLALATIAVVALHAACSGETVKPPSPLDASADETSDTDRGIPPIVGVADSGIIPCSLGDEPIVCPAALTGCPSLSVCSERFGLRCPCRNCTFALEPDACFWTVIADYPDATWIDRIASDGGLQRLPRVAGPPCGDDEFGFFVTWVPGTTTVTLCPASCAEHQDDPTITFKLGRGPCPIP
jgi:hypothetical protein